MQSREQEKAESEVAMSSYIEPVPSVAEAWLRTLESVYAAGGYAINVMTTITDPLATEKPEIRSAIDAVLVEGYRSGTRIQSVNTVAGTIFPSDLYTDLGYSYDPEMSPDAKAALDVSASDLYQSYIEMLPVLMTDKANNRGTYFGRMVSWPGKTGGGRNQIADRITSLRRARNINHTRRNIDDIAVGGEAEGLVDEAGQGLQVYAASDRRLRGFPCLVHIDLTLFDGRLSMAAVYRHQYLVTKAYGNLLGLAQLQGFLAQQSGYEVGELVVHATMADAELDTYTKAGIAELIFAASRGGAL
jgi:hypothetical protein